VCLFLRPRSATDDLYPAWRVFLIDPFLNLFPGVSEKSRKTLSAEPDAQCD
jgi:hypothetical protein